MQYRRFGKTDWLVSEIAFGAWQIGGDWGKVDDEESIATLLYAFDKGINFVDSAELYGRGHSEEVIGQALRQWTGEKICRDQSAADPLARSRRRRSRHARALPRLVSA